MPDLYLYDDVPVLKNKLSIKDDKALDLVEAEQSRQKMMILYERGFDDFSPDGLRSIHRALFRDIYDWAGEYRIINIEKREELMAASAGYVRDSFVMASIDQYSEYEHLEKILLDAVCDEPIEYDEASLDESEQDRSVSEKYKKYQKEKYEPKPHYKRED